jgi:superfamily II DNA helicase RecQ
MELAVDPAIIDSLPHPLTRAHHLILETRHRTGFIPYRYQVEFALVFDEGKDVLCVTGTGAGKSLAFVMVSFLRSDTMIWIVSPLNVIEDQMAENYRKLGLRAVSVNAATINVALIKVRPNRMHSDILTLQPRTLKLASTTSSYRPQKPIGTPTSSDNACFPMNSPIATIAPFPTRPIAS